MNSQQNQPVNVENEIKSSSSSQRKNIFGLLSLIPIPIILIYTTLNIHKFYFPNLFDTLLMLGIPVSGIVLSFCGLSRKEKNGYINWLGIFLCFIALIFASFVLSRD